MKNIRERIVELFKKGYCTPQILKLAKALKEPSATVHYNIKRLEEDGVIKAYKAVMDYKKIGAGFCSYVLINLLPDEYGDPERIARELSKFPQIESIDIITGDWELVVKVRTRDIDDYYQFVKRALSRKGIGRIKTLNSLKQVKTEFVEV